MAVPAVRERVGATAAARTPAKRPAPRSRIEKFGMRHKRQVVRIHRWLALVFGIWAVLQGLSGVTIVAADKLAHISHPNLYTQGNGDLGPGPAIAAAVKAVPGAKFAASTVMPTAADGVYRVGVVVDPVKFTQRLVYVDPATARVNGVRDPQAGAAAFASRWHTNLLQDPNSTLLGVKPQQVVGWLGVATIFILLSGMYLWWWPSVRRWKAVRQVRRHRGTYTFGGDVHLTVGVLALPFLILMLATGLNIAFPRQMRSAWYAVTPGADAGKRADAAGVTTPPVSKPQAGVKPIGLDKGIAAAEQAVAHSRALSVQGSGGKPEGVITVKLSHGWDPARGAEAKGGNTTAYIDQFSAQPVRIVRPEQKPFFGQAYEYWAFAVHTGTFGSWVSRLVWSIVSLAPLVMLSTGLLTMSVRRSKQMRRRRRVRSALPGLTRTEVTSVVGSSVSRDVEAGTVIAKQGDPSDAFYILVKGEMRVTLANSQGVQREMAVLGPGAHFGEMGLLYNAPRTASVEAMTACELLVLAKPGFEKLVAMSATAHEDLLNAADQRHTEQVFSRLRRRKDGS